MLNSKLLISTSPVFLFEILALYIAMGHLFAGRLCSCLLGFLAVPLRTIFRMLLFLSYGVQVKVTSLILLLFQVIFLLKIKIQFSNIIFLFETNSRNL